jgi:hypothetical protein
VSVESQNDLLPKNTWRVLGLAAVLLLAVTVTAIGFISSGFFDPQPVGELRAELSPGLKFIASKSQQIQWLDYPLTAENFSLRLTAAHEAGELDVGYGLAVGSNESALVIGLSPLGYAGIFMLDSFGMQSRVNEIESSDELDNMIANRLLESEQFLGGLFFLRTGSETILFDWQPWPHVRGEQETNEIWLDKSGGEIIIHINRELLWQGELLIPVSSVGLWSGSYNEAGTMDFNSLAIFWD